MTRLRIIALLLVLGAVAAADASADERTDAAIERRRASGQPDPAAAPPSACAPEALEPEDEAVSARAAAAPRRPRARVALMPPKHELGHDEMTMEARDAHRLSETRLFGELGRRRRAMAACYDRVLRGRPGATGSVVLEVTTRDDGALEAEVRAAADEALAHRREPALYLPPYAPQLDRRDRGERGVERWDGSRSGWSRISRCEACRTTRARRTFGMRGSSWPSRRRASLKRYYSW